jgi:hypothetical protein
MDQVAFIMPRPGMLFFYKDDMIELLETHTFPEGLFRILARWGHKFLKRLPDMPVCPKVQGAYLDINNGKAQIRSMYVPNQGTYYLVEDFQKYMKMHLRKCFEETADDFGDEMTKEQIAGLRKDFKSCLKRFCDMIDYMGAEAKRYEVSRN